MTNLIQRLAAFANDLSNTGESDGEELLLSAIEELESAMGKPAMTKHLAIELAEWLENAQDSVEDREAATLLRSIPNKDAEIERLKAVIDQPRCDTCELAILDRDLMRKFISETGQAERFGHFVMLGADDPLVTSRGQDT